MAGLSFGNTIDVLKNAMAGASAAHSALAHNIANANTPEFHRSTVSFKSELAAAAGMNENSQDLVLASNGSGNSNSTQGLDSFTPTVSVDEQTKMRQDGNNVDIDQEMANLSMNADYSQTNAQFLKSAYSIMHQAIAEQ
jgi:flagellar basal-body rod protein FlgB